jgi:hypothetical protein
MKNIKFVVKVSRGDVRAPEYVQRLDRIPIQMTKAPHEWAMKAAPTKAQG